MRISRSILVLAMALSACSQGKPQPRSACSGAGAVGSICGFENPEDITYVPGHDLLIVSNLRLLGRGGFLSAVSPEGGTPVRMWPDGASADDGKGGVARSGDMGEPGCRMPDPTVFAPHGVFVDVRDPIAPVLYVINHGGRESIEIFSFAKRGDETRLYWSACIELPENTSGNDLVVAPDGEVIVSNYIPPTGKTWSNLKMALGWNTGDLIAWSREKRWRHLPGTEASAPNGVEVSPDGRWIYFSETGGGTIDRVAREGGQLLQVKVDGLPDNLTWSSKGTLLLASHASGLAFLRCLRNEPCRSPWLALEVNPQSLASAPIFKHDGDAVGAVATILERRGKIYFSAVFGDRIGVAANPLATP